MIFVGVDWAEAHHDVHVQDEDGKRLGGAGCLRVWKVSPGFTSWPRRPVDEPAEVVIGIETDRGLFAAALIARAIRCSR